MTHSEIFIVVAQLPCGIQKSWHVLAQNETEAQYKARRMYPDSNITSVRPVNEGR